MVRHVGLRDLVEGTGRDLHRVGAELGQPGALAAACRAACKAS